MPKSRTGKAKGTYEWIHASLDLPPVGIRPTRAGNNDTGAKGKLKCAGCRLSKIRCIYDYSNVEASCSNCVRRGTQCGIKLPGPKTRVENAVTAEGEIDGNSQRMNEYVRLFERFQRLRPNDGADDIDNLVTLVENGTLKEQDGTFIVTPPQYIEEMGKSDWEPSSHNTARIPVSEFVDGYFSVPERAATGPTGQGFMIEPDIPRGFSLSGPPVPWVGPVHHMDGTFRNMDYAFEGPTPGFPEVMGMFRYQ